MRIDQTSLLHPPSLATAASKPRANLDAVISFPGPTPAPPVKAAPAETGVSRPVGLDDLLTSFGSAPATTSAGPSTLAGPAAPSTDDAPPPATGATITLQGLFDAWGQASSLYDLNGDGTVNVDDLLAFLAQGADTGTDEPLTLEGLLAAFGTTDSPYDLNGDATVNVDDLLLFLAQMETEGADAGQNSLLHATGEGNDEPLTLEGLLAAFGATDSPYDLNGDSIVDVDDLMAFLASQSAPPPASQHSLASTTPLTVATALIAKLESEGFVEAPPTNLQGVVGALGLDLSARMSVLKLLALRFPEGLGVDEVV